jgi:hypothetical protein
MNGDGNQNIRYDTYERLIIPNITHANQSKPKMKTTNFPSNDPVKSLQREQQLLIIISTSEV